MTEPTTNLTTAGQALFATWDYLLGVGADIGWWDKYPAALELLDDFAGRSDAPEVAAAARCARAFLTATLPDPAPRGEWLDSEDQATVARRAVFMFQRCCEVLVGPTLAEEIGYRAARPR